MQDQSSHDQSQAEPDTQTNLFLRGDTILGACEGIGQDFGFNPNWLRVVFAGSFYWNPAAVIGAYVALALVVAMSRLLFPARPASATDAARLEASPLTPAAVHSDTEGALSLAA